MRCAKCSAATAPSYLRATSTPAPRCFWADRFAAKISACFISIPKATSSKPRRIRIYFQLGESKYGKPIIDRVVNSATNPVDAAKCVLISFDSTIRSNISVGLPIDLAWYARDSLSMGFQKRIEEGNPYFNMLRHGWGSGLRRVFGELPNPDWMG